MLALIGMAVPAQAEISNSVCRATGTEMCSKTFYGGGTCNNVDQLPILETPWEDRAIRIVGVSFTIEMQKPGFFKRTFNKPEKAYSSAGNSHSPDIMMTMMGEGTTPSPFFPAGTYFSFPGKKDAEDPHVDLHVQCTGGRAFGAIMTIFYQLEPPAPTPVAQQ